MILISPSLIFGLLATYGVAQFGSASFDDREAGQRLVEALGGSAKSALNSALCSAIKSNNPEIVRRCETALCKLNDFGLMWKPRLDCFSICPGHPDYQLWKFPLRICKEDAYYEWKDRKSRPSDDWIQRRATIHLTALLLRIKWSRNEIRKCLLEMQRREMALTTAFATIEIAR
jgi:hypothetical protein